MCAKLIPWYDKTISLGDTRTIAAAFVAASIAVMAGGWAGSKVTTYAVPVANAIDAGRKCLDAAGKAAAADMQKKYYTEGKWIAIDANGVALGDSALASLVPPKIAYFYWTNRLDSNGKFAIDFNPTTGAPLVYCDVAKNTCTSPEGSCSWSADALKAGVKQFADVGMSCWFSPETNIAWNGWPDKQGIRGAPLDPGTPTRGSVVDCEGLEPNEWKHVKHVPPPQAQKVEAAANTTSTGDSTSLKGAADDAGSDSTVSADTSGQKAKSVAKGVKKLKKTLKTKLKKKKL